MLRNILWAVGLFGLLLPGCEETEADHIDGSEGALIEAGDVHAGDVTAGEVTAGAVTAGAVTAGDVEIEDVQAGGVSAGAVTAGNVSAGAVQALEVYAGDVAAGTVQAGGVQAGAVSAGPITSTGDVLLDGPVDLGGVNLEVTGAGLGIPVEDVLLVWSTFQWDVTNATADVNNSCPGGTLAQVSMVSVDGSNRGLLSVISCP